MENIVERTNYDIGWLLDNVNHNRLQIGWEQLEFGVMMRLHNLYKLMMGNDYCSDLLMDYLKDHYCSECSEELEEENDEAMEV